MGRPLAVLATALGVVSVGAGALPGAAVAHTGSPAPGAPPPGVVVAAGGGPSLTLLAQAPWVGPGQTMPLRLDLGTHQSAGLTLGITLYQRLTNRSAFAETAGGTPVGAPLSSSSVPAGSLPADPQGGVDLTVAVQSGDAASTGSGQLTADLHCAAGSCGGVYPLRLQLSSSAGGQRAQLFTYLVYDNPPASTEKLRFAMVVPVSAPASPASSGGTGPDPVLGAAAIDRIDTLTGTLAAHDAPFTLVPEPATVASLQASGHPHARSALAALGTLSTATGHQTVAQTFVPVDASALVASGLGSELDDQVRRAAQVLAPLHPSEDTWLSTGTLDQAALSALSGLGFRHLVVPASAVAQSPGSPLTPTRPFALGSGRTPSEAVESDPALSAHLAAATGPGAALAAYQLLADLALVYYEQPNLVAARGVVAVPAAGWSPSPTFLATVLSALPADPIVSPVSVSQLFDDVTPATAAARRPASTTTAAMPTRQIRSARTRLSGFASAVGQSGTAQARALDDLLLHSEDARLRASLQRQWLQAAGAALSSQLSLLSIRTDTVRLTSSAARIPVTLLKQSGWSASGTLQIVGDKVVFPPANQQDPGAVCRDPSVEATAGRSRFACTATISHATNAVYVAMRARATGDFRLTVTFTSPRDGLVLASSHLTVRSLSTSVVAILLSLAAIAVLLLWWGRTLWRGRRPPRRGAHVRRTPRHSEPSTLSRTGSASAPAP